MLFMIVKNHNDKLPTPCYVFSQTAIEKNMARASLLQKQTDCRILLALKGFAVWRLAEYFRPALYGVSASSLYEARLGTEEFGGEVHVYAPAYRPQEFARIKKYASHMVFNSQAQWEKFGKNTKHNCGIRVNPGYSEVSNPLYDPCRPKSHFGVAAADTAFIREDNNIQGLHFHALCEQNADALERVADHVHRKFGECLKKLQWINLGGGHLLSKSDYDVALLVSVIKEFQQKYKLTVYLEPGAGLVSDCCTLATTVLDVLPGGAVVLDCSASAHIPDVIEDGYLPDIVGAAAAGEKPYTYRLCGCTCMAGDIFGDYSFAKPLAVGDVLHICDTAAYTIVKHTLFNGVASPSIVLQDRNGLLKILRRPAYSDYRRRMA